MLRTVILAALLALAVPPLSAAQDGGDGAEIRAVIERQLEAFQRDDAEAAFSFASPDIQRKFGDPATFMRMVREGYAPVYRPRTVEFRELAEVEGRLAQTVVFVGPDGRSVQALYFMERQGDGSWRIDGVLLTDLPDQLA